MSVHVAPKQTSSAVADVARAGVNATSTVGRQPDAAVGLRAPELPPLAGIKTSGLDAGSMASAIADVTMGGHAVFMLVTGANATETQRGKFTAARAMLGEILANPAARSQYRAKIEARFFRAILDRLRGEARAGTLILTEPAWRARYTELWRAQAIAWNSGLAEARQAVASGVPKTVRGYDSEFAIPEVAPALHTPPGDSFAFHEELRLRAWSVKLVDQDGAQGSSSGNNVLIGLRLEAKAHVFVHEVDHRRRGFHAYRLARTPDDLLHNVKGEVLAYLHHSLVADPFLVPRVATSPKELLSFVRGIYERYSAQVRLRDYFPPGERGRIAIVSTANDIDSMLDRLAPTPSARIALLMQIVQSDLPLLAIR